MISPLWLSLGQRCVFRCNLPPAFLAEWPGLFTCHCGNTGVEWTPNKSRHTNWLWKRQFSHHSCRDSNLQPFDHESGALTNKLSLFYCCSFQTFHFNEKTWACSPAMRLSTAQTLHVSFFLTGHVSNIFQTAALTSTELSTVIPLLVTLSHLTSCQVTGSTPLYKDIVSSSSKLKGKLVSYVSQ